jgi:hypothetical protein
MMLRSCSYEKEVTQELKAGHWPEGCAAELRAHVEACASCSDLVLVTQTFQQAKSGSVKVAPAGSPGLLWWKAQLRRRNAAAERISRPITVAQAFAWIVTSIVGVLLAATQYNHGVRWAEWFSKPAIGHISSAISNSSDGSGWNYLLLIFAVGTVALLSGIVAYLVAERS